MASGGYRPGAGRPRKEDKEAEAAAMADTARYATPLDYMLAVMNDVTAEPARRDRMAIAAAPFIHAKPGEAGKKEGRAEAAREAAQGKFRASEPPRLPVSH